MVCMHACVHMQPQQCSSASPVGNRKNTGAWGSCFYSVFQLLWTVMTMFMVHKLSLKEEGEWKLAKFPREIFKSFQIYVRLLLSERVTCSMSTKGDHKQQLWSIFLATNCSYSIRSNLHGCRERTPCNSKCIICLETARGERSLKLSLN